MKLSLGLVQMTSTNRHEGNVAFARKVVAEGAELGCELIAFPEVAGMMNNRIDADRDQIGDAQTDPFITACRELAARYGVWIHTGSTPVVNGVEGRFLNHSNLIDPTGRLVASYDKVHLFDIYPDDAPPILESRRYTAGRNAVLAETPWGRMGLSVCYDLRFPQFYRDYAKDGATLLFVPSAFTVATGRAHWQVLLRARAIENGAFVVAAAQTGKHDDGRETYGHSMVVDPWGRVLCNMRKSVGIRQVTLDISKVAEARTIIPSLKNERVYKRRNIPKLDA